MPSPILVDTNVPVYEHDQRDPRKQARAHYVVAQLMDAGRLLVSTQVLSEFHWAVTRKLPEPLSQSEARLQVHRLVRFARVVPITVSIITTALEAVDRYQFAIWDAQIWSAARLSGCPIVLSEDFFHRQTLDGVTFLNPFAEDFDLREVLT